MERLIPSLLEGSRPNRGFITHAGVGFEELYVGGLEMLIGLKLVLVKHQSVIEEDRDFFLSKLIVNKYARVFDECCEFIEFHGDLLASLHLDASVGFVYLFEERLIGLVQVVARFIPIPLFSPDVLVVEVGVFDFHFFEVRQQFFLIEYPHGLSL